MSCLQFPCRARESLCARWRVNSDDLGMATQPDMTICSSILYVLSAVPVSCSGELVRQVACLQMRTSLSSAAPGSGHWESMRRSITTKALTKKKRVVKMLFAVVLEFFICWTPLYIINTVVLFEPVVVYNVLGFHTISYFQLLAYCSSCCNPITYCFMNSSFRQAFLKLFRCFHKERTKRTF
ncbi:hypothetical protein J6590_089991 [Homalodisca vitripennis]|nr:hypothetical protein J6590_089991 [Homalodisca vitripennis]